MDIYTDDDLFDLVKETHELAKENNQLLRAMRRAQIRASILRSVFYVVVIGLPVVLYYYILAPYISDMRQTIQEVQGEVEEIQTLRETLPERAQEYLERFL